MSLATKDEFSLAGDKPEIDTRCPANTKVFEDLDVVRNKVEAQNQKIRTVDEKICILLGECTDDDMK